MPQRDISTLKTVSADGQDCDGSLFRDLIDTFTEQRQINDVLFEGEEPATAAAGNADTTNYWVNEAAKVDSPSVAHVLRLESNAVGTVTVAYVRKDGANSEILKSEAFHVIAGDNDLPLDLSGVDLSGSQVYIAVRAGTAGTLRYYSGFVGVSWWFASDGSAWTSTAFGLRYWLLYRRPQQRLIAGNVDIASALADEDVVQLPGGDITVTSQITIPAGKTLRGVRGKTRLMIGSTSVGVLLNSDGGKIEDLMIVGESAEVDTSFGISSDADIEALTGMGTQVGLKIEGSNTAGLCVSDVEVSNIDGVGVDITGASSAPYSGAGLIEGVYVHDCFVGFRAQSTGEYARFVGNAASDNIIGLLIDAGNFVASGCNVSGNRVNLVVGDSVNDSHGSIVGCQVNHADVHGVYMHDIDNGMMITGCQFWYSKIRMVNCKGPMFVANILGQSNIEHEDCPFVAFLQNGFSPSGGSFSETGTSSVVAKKDNYRIDDGDQTGLVN